MKALYIVISVVHGNILRSLRKRPTALLTLANSKEVNEKTKVKNKIRFWIKKKLH